MRSLGAVSSSRCQRSRRADPATYRERVLVEVDAEEFPNLAEVGSRWVPLTTEDTYVEGLTALVDGFLATRP
jgi:hypothetical protein